MNEQRLPANRRSFTGRKACSACRASSEKSGRSLRRLIRSPTISKGYGFFTSSLLRVRSTMSISRRRISADIDVPAMRRAFQTLVDRHPALRTTFPVHFGKPIQRVDQAPKVHFQEVESSAWSLEELNIRLLEEAYRPFDLERGPLLRVTLFTRSAREHILLLVVHHIVIDFWSLAILLDELSALYPGGKRRRESAFASSQFTIH